MTTRILGPTGSPRRRRFLLIPILVVAASALFLARGAQAVHTGFFELGPTPTAPEAGITNIVGNATDPGPDWADLFTASGGFADSDSNGIPDFEQLYGGLAAAFIGDQSSAGGAVDFSTFSGFGTSNKNVDPVSTADCTAAGNSYPSCTPWGWAPGNIPAKDDLTNVYAYETVNPANNHLLLYGGAEREDPSGDSHLDLEFFQNQVALCEPASRTPSCDTFTGARKVNDVIVSMDYLQGGALGSVTIRKWTGSDYVLEGTAGGEGCFSGDTICAFNNGASINGGPWPNYDNHGHVITTLPKNAFTEMGVDLTALVGASPCLSTFMAKTRSSGSFTSELKDFAGPTSFAPCKPSTALSVDLASKTVHSGDSVTLTFSELNNGNEALNNPSVVGNNGCSPTGVDADNDGFNDGDANKNGILDPLETWTFTCTVSNITANTTITAYGQGTGALSGILVTGNPTCTSSTTTICSSAERTTTAITVISPSTFLLKKAKVDITYTYYEKNTGDDPLTSVSVTDDKCSSVNPVLASGSTDNIGDTNSNDKLDPGEIWEFQCTASSSEGSDYDVTNTGTGHGTDSLGGDVPTTNESDSVRVQVTHTAPNSFP